MSRTLDHRAFEIRTWWRVALLVSVLLCTLGSARIVRAADALDPYELKIRELLLKTGALDLGKQMAKAAMNGMSQGSGGEIPEAAATIIEETALEFFEAIFSDEQEIVKFQAELYRPHFTLEELEQIVEFYDSPLGAKLVRVLPQLIQAGMAWGEAKAQAQMPAFQAELQRRFEAAGLLPSTQDPG
jgi:hypothetical protein